MDNDAPSVEIDNSCTTILVTQTALHSLKQLSISMEIMDLAVELHLHVPTVLMNKARLASANLLAQTATRADLILPETEVINVLTHKR